MPPLLIYLLFGLISMTGAFIIRAMAHTLDPAMTWKRYGAIVLTFLPFWPIYLIYSMILDWRRWHVNRICYWCGAAIPNNPDDLCRHVDECEKSPVAKELRAAREVCKWVDLELSAEKFTFVDWKGASERMSEWWKVKLQ